MLWGIFRFANYGVSDRISARQLGSLFISPSPFLIRFRGSQSVPETLKTLTVTVISIAGDI